MITVVNKRTHPPGDPTVAYVGRDRDSPLGNPFRIGPDGDREVVIARYRDWLAARLAEPGSPQRRAYDRLLARARRGDLALMCWWKEPDREVACHGDVIADRLGADL